MIICICENAKENCWKDCERFKGTGFEPDVIMVWPHWPKLPKKKEDDRKFRPPANTTTS